jgi:hypothetical protein
VKKQQALISSSEALRFESSPVFNRTGLVVDGTTREDRDNCEVERLCDESKVPPTQENCEGVTSILLGERIPKWTQ